MKTYPTLMDKLTTSSSSAVLGTLANKCPPTYSIRGQVLHIFPWDTDILQIFVKHLSPCLPCLLHPPGGVHFITVFGWCCLGICRMCPVRCTLCSVSVSESLHVKSHSSSGSL
ncbi:hypothetical protein PO909_006391 [Leuciscus waleckii]